MKIKSHGVVLTAAVVLGLAVPVTLVAQAADKEQGRALFQNPQAFGGEVSCSSCHPGGSGLEQAGDKTTFNIMGEVQNSLAEAVNFCIVNANQGQAIAEDSDEMKNIVAYIKSLKAPAASGYGAPPPAPGPGYGRPPATPGYGAPPPAPGPGYGR